MNQSVTYLKAFGIMLVVLGHTMNPVPHLNSFIFMFHMPLFLFISGYCFKRKYLQEPKAYVGKRLKGIYWPYVKWSLIFLALHNVWFLLDIYNAGYCYGGKMTAMYGLKDFIKYGLLIVTVMRGHDQLLGGYWFLNDLFFGSLIAFVMLKICKRTEIGVVVCLAMSWLLNCFNNNIYVYNFGISQFYTAALIMMGMIFAERNVPVFHWWGIALSLVLTFIGSLYWQLNIGTFPYYLHLMLPFFVTAVLATWSFYSLFAMIKRQNVVTRFLTFVGENTLTILTWHLLVFKVTSLIIIKIHHLPIERLAEFPVIGEYSSQGWWVCYGILSFAICCCIAYCNRFIKNYWLKL